MYVWNLAPSTPVGRIILVQRLSSNGVSQTYVPVSPRPPRPMSVAHYYDPRRAAVDAAILGAGKQSSSDFPSRLGYPAARVPVSGNGQCLGGWFGLSCYQSLSVASLRLHDVPTYCIVPYRFCFTFVSSSVVVVVTILLSLSLRAHTLSLALALCSRPSQRDQSLFAVLSFFSLSSEFHRTGFHLIRSLLVSRRYNFPIHSFAPAARSIRYGNL